MKLRRRPPWTIGIRASDCEVRDPSLRPATSAQDEYINGPRRPIDKRIDERRDFSDRRIAEVILDYSWVRVEDRTKGDDKRLEERVREPERLLGRKTMDRLCPPSALLRQFRGIREGRISGSS